MARHQDLQPDWPSVAMWLWDSFSFRVALQDNVQGVAVFAIVFSQRRSILQVHLCILCNCNKYYRTIRQVSVSTHIYWHPTHVSAETDKHATIEVLLETVFSTRSVERGYKEDDWVNNSTRTSQLRTGVCKEKSSVGREPLFREDLSTEGEK
jgi:hypothetical protein